MQAVVSHWHHPTLRIHSPVHNSSTHVTVVPSNESVEAALHPKNPETWELERFDAVICGYAGPLRPLRCRRQTENPKLIANFKSSLYYLDGTVASFAGKVKTRLNRIEQTQYEYGPVGDDLLDVPVLLHSSIDVREATITDLDQDYGFTNYSGVDLFPYFCYVDPSDYSARAWYVPPSPTILALLQQSLADGTPSLFAFCYGTSPIEFCPLPGRKTDSGFLKLFLTTTYVDMAIATQSSVNEAPSTRGPRYLFKDARNCETFVLTCGRA